AHVLRGRVGRHEVGVRGLELLQSTQPLVELGVGDRRRVELVVPPIVLVDLGAQGVDLVGRVHRAPTLRGHRSRARRQAPADKRAATAWSVTRSATRVARRNAWAAWLTP